jgi:SAM-dependent methyltransferase
LNDNRVEVVGKVFGERLTLPPETSPAITEEELWPSPRNGVCACSSMNSMNTQQWNYRAFVGPQEVYYRRGRRVFELLLRHGLNECHYFLDIGCGSLRIGRLLIPLLLPGRYFGVEPEQRYLHEGLANEVVGVFGQELLRRKSPTFDHNKEFRFSQFAVTFDCALAASVFIHCGKEQLLQCLRNLKPVMSPQGRLFLDVGIADTTSEKGRSRRYAAASHAATRYAEEDLHALLQDQGARFRVVDEHQNTGRRIYLVSWSNPPSA